MEGGPSLAADKTDKIKEPKRTVPAQHRPGRNQRPASCSCRSARPIRRFDAVGSSIYYIRSTRGAEKPGFIYSIWPSKKETALGQFGGYEISANGRQDAGGQGQHLCIIDLDPRQRLPLAIT